MGPGVRREARVWRSAPLAAALLLAACATPLESGERLYQQGDRIGAIDAWRRIPDDSHEHAGAQQRIAAVEDEQQKLLARYEQRARYFERKGRIAESILSWRVVLKLDPDDTETLAHVQDLSRQLAARKSALDTSFRTALEQGRLADARAGVEELRRLDPFDPAAESGEREVETAPAPRSNVCWPQADADSRRVTTRRQPTRFERSWPSSPRTSPRRGISRTSSSSARASGRRRPRRRRPRVGRPRAASRRSSARRTSRFVPRGSTATRSRPSVRAIVTVRFVRICVRWPRTPRTPAPAITSRRCARSSRRKSPG